MKNKELALLLQKYKGAINIGLVSLSDLLECSDEERKVYQEIDIEKIVSTINRLSGYRFRKPFETVKDFLSLSCLREHKKVRSSYLQAASLLSTFPDNLDWENACFLYREISYIGKSYIDVEKKQLEYYKKHIKLLKKELASEDSVSLKIAKIHSLSDWIRQKNNFDLPMSPYHFEDMTAIFEAKDREHVVYLSDYAKSPVAKEVKPSIHKFDFDMIKNASSESIAALTELAKDENAVLHPSHELVMTILNEAPDPCILKVAQDKRALDSPYYIEDLLKMGKLYHEEKASSALDQQKGNVPSEPNKDENFSKLQMLASVVIDSNSRSLDFPNHASDMELIASCKDLDLCKILTRLAAEDSSL